MEKTTDSPWFVYVVRCADGALYTGITNQLQRRIAKHNSGKGSKSCRAHGLPVILQWSKQVADKSAALKMEVEIKRMSKDEKEMLVN